MGTKKELMSAPNTTISVGGQSGRRAASEGGNNFSRLMSSLLEEFITTVYVSVGRLPSPSDTTPNAAGRSWPQPSRRPLGCKESTSATHFHMERGPWKQPEGLFLLTLIFHEKIRTGMKEGLQKSVGSCTLNILSKERSNLFPRPVPYFFPKFPI